MSGQDQSLAGHVARAGLTCLEPVYRGVVRIRNEMFRTGLRKPRRLPKPVISIGNITTGGTGKTPMVIDMVQRLEAMGQRPAVLMRGYGEDEFVEIDQAVGNGRFPKQIDELGIDKAAAQTQVPVVANSNRYEAGLTALKRRGEISVFVLDDGFQHQQLARDLDLVLIDATQPFGYGRVLPRGLLREPVGQLRRASEMIVTRSDRVSAEVLESLDERIKKLTGKLPIAHVVHRWSGFHVANAHPGLSELSEELPALWDGDEMPLESLKGKKVLAACAIGNPKAFFDAIRELECERVETRTFADHHDYKREEVIELYDVAGKSDVDALVMTEKDMVKWNKFIAPWSDGALNVFDQLTDPVPIYRPCLTIEYQDGEKSLNRLLQVVFGERGD